ncbi:MAG: FAD binding domain-containing protein [Myxococcales bacterium]|nr:FAD binding domain-containing protein [Myxococcales bacterium]
MLRMPEFEVHQPTTAAEAVALKAELADALYVAGGTDLLPNLKHWLHEPRHLVSLASVSEMNGIQVRPDGSVTIGAATTLHAVATHDHVVAQLPGLAQAVGSIAGPQHRRMGTIGGNVMLDTRCLFYNQSLPWRQAVGYCLKKDGTWCHVIGSAKACVAAQSSDSVPMLAALSAQLCFVLPDGETQRIDLVDLYTKDGRFEQNHTVPEHALLTAIELPAPTEGHRSVYRKVRARGAVDFPQLSVAVAGGFLSDGTCTSLSVVIGAMLPFPKVLPGTDVAVGTSLPDEVIEALATRAAKQARPQAQIHGSPDWRRHVAGVETHRGLRDLRDRASSVV